MMAILLAGCLALSAIPLSLAASSENDVVEAATTLARIDVCETGISRSERAALEKRMKNSRYGTDGTAFYQDEKARILSENASARARECDTVQSYETN